MNHPIVLDACTIINLLRIDEDECLFKLIDKMSVNIAETVFNEVKINYNKKNLSKEQEKYINQIIPAFTSKIREDNIIKKDLDSYFSQMCKFVNHIKKENGELLSSALSLILSRETQCRAFFITDDYYAKQQFAPYFEYQQVGGVYDSVDFLIFLYWNTNNFSINFLKKKLQDLYSEYQTPLKKIFDQLEEKKQLLSRKNIKQNKVQIDNINNFLSGYHNADIKLMINSVSFFEKNKQKYSDTYGILKDYKKNISENYLSIKIMNTLKKIKDIEIFKLN
jgi:hypothetical protein